MIDIAASLGVETADYFRRVAREGALQTVSGIGPSTERKILARLDADPRRPRRGLTLNIARELVERIAEALGGEVAGDPRRWADLSFDLAVVVPASRPAQVLAGVRTSSPDRHCDRARGAIRSRRDRRRAYPSRPRLPEPDRFGSALVEQPGSREYVEALGALPDAATRAARVRGARVALVSAGAPRGTFPRHSTGARRAGGRPRRSPLPYDLVGRSGERPRDGGGRPRARLCVHRHLRPHADVGAVRVSTPTISGARPRRSLRRTSVSLRSACPAGRRMRHTPRRQPRPSGRPARRARVGAAEPSRGSTERCCEITASVTEAMRHPAVRCLSHPKGRIINHRPPNALDLEAGDRSRSRDRGRARDQRPARPAGSRGRARASRSGRRGSAGRLDGRALRPWTRQHGACGRDRPPSLGDARGRAEHASPRQRARAPRTPIASRRDRPRRAVRAQSCLGGGDGRTDPGFFAELAEHQSPEYLWIGCSDSRVPANQIVGLAPGDVFVHRNVANVVVHTDLNCLSVMQFAVDVLKVSTSSCAATTAAAACCRAPRLRLGLIDNWLRHVQDVGEKHAPSSSSIARGAATDRLCELNVIEQVVNVCQTTIVEDAWAREQSLTVHGMDLRARGRLPARPRRERFRRIGAWGLSAR